jgi:kynurenine formamidase
MIKEKGIRLIENLALEDLRKDGIREFLFVCMPLLIKGGSGSPVTPLAII